MRPARIANPQELTTTPPKKNQDRIGRIDRIEHKSNGQGRLMVVAWRATVFIPSILPILSSFFFGFVVAAVGARYAGCAWRRGRCPEVRLVRDRVIDPPDRSLAIPVIDVCGR